MTAFYAEYKNTGTGYQPAKRVSWSRQLTGEEAKEYTIEKIMGDWEPVK
jgi:pectinesterase